MLPAPHSNFFENTAIASTRRLGGPGRLVVADEKLLAPMASRPRRLFGPIAVFLGARIGARWSQILAELADRLGDDSNFRTVLPRLTQLVEFRAVEENGQLYHGSGLLKGQPLQAGWRRKLFVCPATGRLKRIPSVSATTPADC
jgi:hypothetical protein